MSNKLMARLALVPAFVASGMGAAHAALPTAVTEGITTAQADIISLLGALTAAGIAVWVVTVIYNRFRVK